VVYLPGAALSLGLGSVSTVFPQPSSSDEMRPSVFFMMPMIYLTCRGSSSDREHAGVIEPIHVLHSRSATTSSSCAASSSRGWPGSRSGETPCSSARMGPSPC